LQRDRLAFFERCARECGDFVPFRSAHRRCVLISHPDLVEDLLVNQQAHFRKTEILRQNRLMFGNGLLTSEGDFWLRQRRLAQPAFHRQRIAAYVADMIHFGERLVDGWRDGQELDAHAAMMHVTLEIVAKTLFGADVSADATDIGQALSVLIETFFRRANRPVRLSERWPTRDNRRLRQVAARLDRIIYGIVEQRRREGSHSDDLLSMLLAAQDEDGSRMTNKQLRDEAMTLFLAGHETTAIALSWAFYLLSQNPDVDAELASELRAVLAGRLPTVEDLPQLPYTSMVVTEAMRLYPPAWVVGRDALEDCTVGGHSIRRGTLVFASQWVIQRDPRWFEAPTQFRPQRWANGLAQELPKFAYFPFGGGQRMCIGNNFATMEAQVLLATIAQRFRLELVPDQRIEPLPSITLRPRYGLRMIPRGR